jgi:hypothetical protein
MVSGIEPRRVHYSLNLLPASHLLLMNKWRGKDSGAQPPLLCPDHNCRVPHISLVFREMWDTAAPPL